MSAPGTAEEECLALLGASYDVLGEELWSHPAIVARPGLEDRIKAAMDEIWAVRAHLAADVERAGEIGGGKDGR